MKINVGKKEFRNKKYGKDIRKNMASKETDSRRG